MDELLNSNYTAVIAMLSQSLQRLFNGARPHTHTNSHWRHSRGWLLLTQGEFREAASILSSKINMLVSLCLCVYARARLWPCVWLLLCVCVCLEMRFTFWSQRGFTGLWVDRSMLSGRHTLSRARIALERPQQSVLAEPVP